jgi:cellulose biosynthesis protein BcsE
MQRFQGSPRVTTDSNRTNAAPADSVLRRWLRAAGRRGFGGRAREPSRLAIDALPDGWATLTPGNLYAIYVMPRTPSGDALIWESAREARVRHVTVVLARSRAEVAARLRELGFTGGLARGWPRNLNVLAMPEPAGSDVDSTGRANNKAPVALAKLFGGLRALKRFGFHSNALYFVEGAERWFSWDDPAALAREGRMLANWCAARKITLVLMFGPTTGATRDDGHKAEVSDDRLEHDASQPGHHEFHGACAGVARLQRTHGELLWHVDFWRTGAALVTGEVRSLRFTDSGHLTVAPESAGSPGLHGIARLAHDERRVVVTRAVIGREAWVPDQWEVVEDQQAALAACAGAQAATVVLDYTDCSRLEALCAVVHTLRRQCGRALKIVVVERGEVLRHQYELLVLSLGANLLLGRGLPFSRIQSLLQSLQGQLHTRPIVADYRTALAAALSDAVLGYLPVGPYCERVQAILERSALLQLPHVLVKLTLLPELSHVDALHSCRPSRAGDVFTADAAHLYVFLFACRLPDAHATLARIFNQPVERLSDHVVYLAEQGIEHELRTLKAANQRAPIADYGDLFPGASAGVTGSVAMGTIGPLVTEQATAHGTAGAGVGAAPTSEPDWRHRESLHLKALSPAEAARQLEAVERALADAYEQTADGSTPDDFAPRTTPRPRRAEPCAMPLRATQSN